MAEEKSPPGPPPEVPPGQLKQYMDKIKLIMANPYSHERTKLDEISRVIALYDNGKPVP